MCEINITKEEIEEMCGYKVSSFKVEEVYHEGELIGLSINTVPVKSIGEIVIDFKIEKEQ